MKEVERRRQEALSMTQGNRFKILVGVRRFNLSVFFGIRRFAACGSGE